MKSYYSSVPLFLAVLLIFLSACPPPKDPDVNYTVSVTWGDYCQAGRVSPDIYELLVEGRWLGANRSMASWTVYELPKGRSLLTIRYFDTEQSERCGGYFIALNGGATFEDGSEFVSGFMDLSMEIEHSYIIDVPYEEATQ